MTDSHPRLFEPLVLRELILRNRSAMSPMCQYSARDGMPNDWHLAHYGSRAALGVGLLFLEATAVEARGRISPFDLGLWSDDHILPHRRLVDAIHAGGGHACVQLAHAGRKAGCAPPWEGGRQLGPEQGGWETVAPSPLAFNSGDSLPAQLDAAGIAGVTAAFAGAAERALDSGYDAIELHGAHGYLAHQFLSPLANHRGDEYGGSFENRNRFILGIVAAVRKVWPESRPLIVRLSATDWVEGAWDLPQTVELAKSLKALGVDLVDVSTGGIVPDAPIKPSPGFQVPFARAIREGAGIPTAAVGLITGSSQAETILEEGSADLVVLGRELLRNPGWVWQAARELGAVTPEEKRRAFEVPSQYLRAL